MRVISRQHLAACWRDPWRRLRHRLYKIVYVAEGRDQRVVQYGTPCGYYATVDDIHERSLVRGMPTCFQCIVAQPLDDMLPTEE